MKVIKFFLFITFSLCFFVSCKDRKNITNVDGGVLKLDIRSVLNEKGKELYISDLTDKIKYIALETNDTCLLISVNDMCLTEENIFVSDSKKLFQFDKSGRFIKQIGAVGRGPGEHDTSIKFTVNTFVREIFILSHMIRMMNVYDLETGAFKRSFKVDIDVSKFYTFPQGNIVFLTCELPVGSALHTIDEVYITDSNGKLIVSFPNYNRLNNNSTTMGYANFYSGNNHELRYMYNFGDTLYSLTEDFIKKSHVVFNLDNKISREKLMVDPFNSEIQFPDFISISKILESNKFIFITLQKGLGVGKWDFINILYDNISENLTPTTGFINDYDGGMSFWPRFSFDNILVTSYEANQVIKYYKSTIGTIRHSESFITLANNLEAGDNPVLVFVENN